MCNLPPWNWEPRSSSGRRLGILRSLIKLPMQRDALWTTWGLQSFLLLKATWLRKLPKETWSNALLFKEVASPFYFEMIRFRKLHRETLLNSFLLKEIGEFQLSFHSPWSCKIPYFQGKLLEEVTWDYIQASLSIH